MSANKIKKFFSRKKEEAKFKLSLGGGIGEGRKLNAETPAPSSSKRPVRDAYVPPTRKELSDEAKTAAAAALARVDKKDRKEFNTSLAAIKAQAKRELETERKLREEAEKSKPEVKSDAIPDVVKKNYACDGVFFRCPLISEEILPKSEWRVKIKDFLYQQFETERGLTACLIIYNCNVKDKVEPCVETLSKYIENIINHPDEEKYFKIRMSNRIFCDKVRYVEGALEFLLAAGFKEQEIDGEPFLLWSKDNVEDGNDLSVLFDALGNAEIIQLELDRNIQVLMPSQARKVELPPEFFRVTAEEIKREQQLKTKAIEEAQILKTKAMRDREELRVLNRYRYSLIRIKFPDGICLQGTFNVYEKLSDIYEFVQSCLEVESLEFVLNLPGGGNFTEDDMDKSLYDLRLIPNFVLLFEPNTNGASAEHFIKDELLMLIQPM